MIRPLTTDHSCDASAIVADAALWLATTPKAQRQRSAVVEIRQRFGISAGQAIEAIRLSWKMQGGAHGGS